MKTIPPEETLPPFDRNAALSQGADDVLCLEGARCALWWRDTPALEGEKAGCIGHYAAEDAAAANLLLAQACGILAEQGATLAVGPMDGNTWRAHRFVVDGGDRPPFFMEPRNPAAWPRHFLENGFRVLENYSSSAVDLDSSCKTPAALDNLERRLTRDHGISVRATDSGRLDDDMRRIFRLASISFRKNVLYQPFTETEFIAMYRRIEPFLVPDLVRVAEADGEIAGFVFAVPDVEAEARWGSRNPAVIVKTVAVRPGHRFAGLGSYLVHEVQRRARERGFREAIHAMQHERNPSLRISARCGAQVFRRYALFARRLAP